MISHTITRYLHQNEPRDEASMIAGVLLYLGRPLGFKGHRSVRTADRGHHWVLQEKRRI